VLRSTTVICGLFVCPQRSETGSAHSGSISGSLEGVSCQRLRVQRVQRIASFQPVAVASERIDSGGVHLGTFITK